MFILPSRRGFLKTGFSSAALVALAPTVPGFLARAAEQTAGKSGETVLVVIQLSGGNDGLNTVVPYSDDVYRRERPLLGIPAGQVHKIDDYVGLHPAMGGFANLLHEGKLGIVQGAGYPQPDRSHFSSMDIWQSAIQDIARLGASPRTTGWLGRYLDARAAGRADRDVPALHLASGVPRLPLALVGGTLRAGSFQSIEAFRLHDDGDAALRAAIDRSASATPVGENDLIAFMHDSTRSALQSSRQIQEAVRHYQTDVKYPATNLAGRLQTVAQLLDAGLSTRIYYLDLDGFDTHSQQAPAHGPLLGQLSDAVSAFIKDVTAHGHGQRVLVMTFSEFGRRVHENASQGTDHGAAAPMFLAGGRVRAGLLTPHPAMTDLDEGDLKFTTDFRSVYAGVLERWLGIESKGILGRQFAPLEIVS